MSSATPPNSTLAVLTQVIDLAGVAIFEHVLADDTVRLNAQAAALLGLANPLQPQQQMTLSMALLRQRLHPDDGPHFLRLDGNRAADRRHRTETRFLLPEGGWGSLLTTTVAQRDAQNQASTVLGVALDITDRRRTELALRHAHERAALAARGAGLGTWDLDLGSGEAVWDEQMWKLRGREPLPHAPSAQERLDFVHPDDRSAIQQRLDAAVEKVASGSQEFRVVWPSGQVRWLASKWGPVRDEKGQVIRRIGVNWDITDKHNADVARQERETALLESRAKTEFLSRMSHKLRTPLNAVLGFSQLLLVDENGADATSLVKRKRLQHVHQAGQDLLGLVNELLDLAHPQSSELPTPVRGARGTILYIEDNPVNTLIVGELVARRHDLKLHLAETGAEGVLTAARHLPDLILLDMQLPDIDGYEVLKRLREHGPTAATPVVALSANAMPQDIERGLAAGLADYWTKPLDFNAFTASINALFGPPPPQAPTSNPRN